MASDDIAAFINTVSKEIAVLLAILGILHAVAAPSVFSVVVLLPTAAVCGIGFGYFRDSDYDVSGGVLLGTTYAILFLILAPLLIVDALYCGMGMVGSFIVGCANTLAAVTGAAIAAATIGFLWQLLYQR
jgi:hypothetical protein